MLGRPNQWRSLKLVSIIEDIFWGRLTLYNIVLGPYLP